MKDNGETAKDMSFGDTFEDFKKLKMTLLEVTTEEFLFIVKKEKKKSNLHLIILISQNIQWEGSISVVNTLFTPPLRHQAPWSEVHSPAYTEMLRNGNIPHVLSTEIACATECPEEEKDVSDGIINLVHKWSADLM